LQLGKPGLDFSLHALLGFAKLINWGGVLTGKAALLVPLSHPSELLVQKSLLCRRRNPASILPERGG
jgi:hypothetical protein